MKIVIIGVGRVGATLGKALILAGHKISFVSRNTGGSLEAKLRFQIAGDFDVIDVSGMMNACDEADAVLLCIPWAVTEETLKKCGPLANKLVLDATNPIALGGNEAEEGLSVGHTNSASELIQSWSPQSKVVKIFNTVGWQNMADTIYDGKPLTMMLCGDDIVAKEQAASLALDVGFDPVDAGPLKVARYLEPMAMLWIHLCYARQFGPNFAFQIVRR